MAAGAFGLLVSVVGVWLLPGAEDGLLAVALWSGDVLDAPAPVAAPAPAAAPSAAPVLA